MDGQSPNVQHVSPTGRWMLLQLEVVRRAGSALEQRLHFDQEIGVFRDVTVFAAMLVRGLQHDEDSLDGPIWCVGSFGPGSRGPLRPVGGAFDIGDDDILSANWVVCYLVRVGAGSGSPVELLAGIQAPDDVYGCEAISAEFEQEGVRSVSAFVVDETEDLVAWQRWESGRPAAGQLSGGEQGWSPSVSDLSAVASELLRPRPESLDTNVAAVLWQADAQSLVPAFLSQQVTDETLFELTDADLKEIGVAALGTRKRLLKAILDRREAIEQAEARDGVVDEGAGPVGESHGAPREVAPDLPLEIPPDDPAPATWDSAVGAVRAALAGVSCVEVAPAPDHRKLEGARAYVGSAPSLRRCLFLYDDTVFRSGKDGIVASEAGIFWRSSFDKPGSMSWQAFESATAAKHSLILQPGEHSLKVSFGRAEGASAIAAALNAAAPIARAALAWEAGAKARLAERTKRAEDMRAREMQAQGFRLATMSFTCEPCSGSGLCRDCGRTGRCTDCGGRGFDHRGDECFTCHGRGVCRWCGGRATCRYCEGSGAVEGPRWVR
jgi:hypothetical protein